MSLVNHCHITIFAKDKETKLFNEQEKEHYHNIKNDKVRGYIIQGEYTKDKVEHYQIYIQFTRNIRYAAIKKIFENDTIHIEPIKYGKIEDCINYCTSDYKDRDGVGKDIWQETKTYGEFKTQGQRTDIEDMINRIKDGERLNKIIIEEPKAARLYMQYSKGFREVEGIIRQSNINEELKEEYENIIWKQWQEALLQYIDAETDKRKIRWMWETTGNTGKSYMTKYLTLFKDAYVITGGKKEDILYAYDGQPLIIFDLPRDFKKDKEYIYEVMEILKNGQYLSTKYQTMMKTFKIPKIIVMANFEPDYERLSKDRYDVINLDKPQQPTVEYCESPLSSDVESESDEPHIKAKSSNLYVKTNKPIKLHKNNRKPLIDPYESNDDDILQDIQHMKNYITYQKEKKKLLKMNPNLYD